MKYFNHLSILLLVFALTLGSSCQNKTEEIVAPMGEECRRVQCTRTVQNCINGYCHCIEGTRQLARGFCINSERGFGYEFATYDQYEDMLDTMVIAFDREPFDTRWVIGDNTWKWIPSYAYNRNLGLENPGGSEMLLVYSGDFFGNQIGLVKLFNLYNGNNIASVIRKGQHYCKFDFNGRFVDRNTIEGNISVYSCPTDDDDLASPRPANLPNVGDLFPVTFSRIP
jgi:hypothetical protein